MGGIDPAVITHRLNTNPSFKPVKQKRRSFAPERHKAINEEVGKLLQAGAIREVEYPEWLANVVLVKKANGKWRLCIDFTDINKACPKDSFPLPRINLIVDATAGHELLSFMDAFFGYNQISMDPDDQEKTSFVTAQGTYCYRVMPFGLKNAGATYQRLVNRMFQKQIGATMEVYIDDMLVKSTTAGLHITHLSEAFQILRNYNMKLNPAKCASCVSADKFLGFIVNHRGIEANPDKIKAVLDMTSPSGIKEVQRLIGRIAALSRFVSRASDKCQPFFQVLKKTFQWDTKCEEAFTTLKTYLSSPPILVSDFILSRIRLLNQRSTRQRQRASTTPSLLLQSSSERSGGEVPENGKINTGAGDCSLEASSLFPGSHHRSPNRISNEAGIAQNRSLRKVDEVGHRAKRVRHQIQTENCDKGTGPSRLRHGIRSDRTC